MRVKLQPLRKYLRTSARRTTHIATNYSRCNFQGKSLRRACNGRTCRRSASVPRRVDGKPVKDVAQEVASKSNGRAVKSLAMIQARAQNSSFPFSGISLAGSLRSETQFPFIAGLCNCLVYTNHLDCILSPILMHKIIRLTIPFNCLAREFR